jgi:two-component system, chemotaxis family, protein-glutamate methylesterase/glutaminase
MSIHREDPPAAAEFRPVVVAASAGGVHALCVLLGALPADFPLPILIVQHLSPNRVSQLAEILGRSTGLTVRQAADGDRALRGLVLIAPPAHHMLVRKGGIIRLTNSPEVLFVRPAADLLFESALQAASGSIIAVVLTGSGHDAARGTSLVHQGGGTVLIQSPAEYESMPMAALEAVGGGGAVGGGEERPARVFVGTLEEIAAELVRLADSGVRL